MNTDKTAATKPDLKEEAKAKYTVGSTPIYIDTKRHLPGDVVALTASQAERLKTLVTNA